jgi:hypothetical protein
MDKEKDMGTFQFSARTYPVCPATFVEVAVLSPSYVFDAFVKTHVGVAA